MRRVFAGTTVAYGQVRIDQLCAPRPLAEAAFDFVASAPYRLEILVLVQAAAQGEVAAYVVVEIEARHQIEQVDHVRHLFALDHLGRQTVTAPG